MESVARIIGKIASSESNISPEQIACAAWKRAVGPKVAAHTRAIKLVRDRLVVEVEDALWQRNLFGLSRTILGNVERAIGPGIVGAVEFRVMPRRRGPERAVESAPGLPQDEADAITDPGLRRIYKVLRQRAG